MSDITIFQFVNARTYIILLGQFLKSIKHHTLMFHLNMHMYILQTFIYSIVNCTIYTIIYMDFLPFFHLQSFFDMYLILIVLTHESSVTSFLTIQQNLIYRS